MLMQQKKIRELALLRLAIGALGEQPKAGWWKSAFCGKNAAQFLSPVFPRTTLLARLNGVAAAACKVHDEHISVGKKFHLFRLPEDVEQGVHSVLSNPETVAAAETLMASVDNVLEYIHEHASDASPAIGPVKVGTTADLTKDSVWRLVAAHYLNAYEHGEQVFPYFVEK